MREEVAVADAVACGGRGVHSFPLVLSTFPLEARGRVLGAVSVAARPVRLTAPPPLALAGPSRCASCGQAAVEGGGGGGCAAWAAEVAPEGKGTPQAGAWSFPAADALASLAAALGPSLALARADADLALLAGKQAPAPAAAAKAAAAPPPRPTAAAPGGGRARSGARHAAAATAADLARLAAAGYGPDGASLSGSDSGEDGRRRGASCCTDDDPSTPSPPPPPALMPCPLSPSSSAAYEAFAALHRARWDGVRLALLALGAAWWAVTCCGGGQARGGPAIMLALLPLLPALPLAAARWAATASPLTPGWYAGARRDSLVAMPRAVAGLLALASAGWVDCCGAGAAPPRRAAAWLAAWAVLVPTRVSVLVPHQAGAAALVAAVAASASGSPWDGAVVLALGCAAPLAVAAIVDEWQRDAFLRGVTRSSGV
jgi:hypothetical protein